MGSLLSLISPGSPVIALLAALQEEASGLQRRMELAPERVAGLSRPAYAGLYQCRNVLLARTGMGRRRAEASVEAVAARYQVATVISIGFTGALEARLEVGDLVLASELIGLTGPCGSEIERTIYQPNQELLRAATEALGATPLRVVLGPTVTVPGIITTPAGRRRLGSQTGAVAVDMESYWVARAAADRGLPFLALRAISDTQEDLLLPFDQMADAYGEPSLRRLAGHLIQDPRSLLIVVRLARNAGRARRVLTTGVARTVATGTPAPTATGSFRPSR
jgi:adenosylhomocysteine nucleosidase